MAHVTILSAGSALYFVPTEGYGRILDPTRPPPAGWEGFSVTGAATANFYYDADGKSVKPDMSTLAGAMSAKP